MSDVTDDEGREDEEQGHHREGRGCTHHLCGTERVTVLNKADGMCPLTAGKVNDNVSGH